MIPALAALFLLAGPPRFLGPPEKKPAASSAPAVAPSDPAPPFAGAVRNASAAGLQRFDLAAIHARPVLISFYAARCKPCREELPVLDELHARYRERGLVVVSIARDAASLLRTRQVRYPVLSDPKNAIASRYLGRKPAWPSFVLIGRDGTIFTVKKAYRGAPSTLLRTEVENALR